MISEEYTHQHARALLHDGDAEGALRVAGPMLENDPADITAWRIAGRALYELGETKGGLKNLGSAATALAEDGNPVQALALIKEIEAIGGAVDNLLSKLAELYGALSPRLKDTDFAPPPLPTGVRVDPWSDDLDRQRVIARATDAMAMAWGAALTIPDRGADLPYVPILSALQAADFVQLAGQLERVIVEGDQQIVEQDTPGDAMYLIAEGSVVVRRRRRGGEAVELARLGPGAFFGEMALISRAGRAAEVLAEERVVLLRAGKAEMDALAERVPAIGDVLIAFCHARMLENLMRVSPVLAPVPPVRRPELIACFDTDYRTAGETIIEQDEDGPGLFLVVSGKVRVLRVAGDEQTVLADLGPGELFGEISLLMRKKSTARVEALESSALLFLSRDDFAAATNEFPELLKGAYDIAVERENKNLSIMGRSDEDADDLILV